MPSYHWFYIFQSPYCHQPSTVVPGKCTSRLLFLKQGHLMQCNSFPTTILLISSLVCSSWVTLKWAEENFRSHPETYLVICIYIDNHDCGYICSYSSDWVVFTALWHCIIDVILIITELSLVLLLSLSIDLTNPQMFYFFCLLRLRSMPRPKPKGKRRKTKQTRQSNTDRQPDHPWARQINSTGIISS